MTRGRTSSTEPDVVGRASRWTAVEPGPAELESSRWRYARRAGRAGSWYWLAIAGRRGAHERLGSDSMGDIAGKVDKAFESVSISELAASPVDALQGVSAGDAEHLAAAFGIKTIRDLGTNKYFLWAQAIAKLAE